MPSMKSANSTYVYQCLFKQNRSKFFQKQKIIGYVKKTKVFVKKNNVQYGFVNNFTCVQAVFFQGAGNANGKGNAIVGGRGKGFFRYHFYQLLPFFCISFLAVNWKFFLPYCVDCKDNVQSLFICVACSGMETKRRRVTAVGYFRILLQ